MGNRWRMNRMGFVNFWLYDEETFHFADGKILLRGQNASGKSITTQSFIPFILDGDRTPSRLDPFGSSDRKMDYYFLGDGERDEATGYLFLEFKRENLEQYRTIGIGQRDQKGKTMTFWGFVILDGRRIGLDMNLYREVGERKLPLTKQELRQTLGEANPCTEGQREYMELVNKYIFGFSSTEQYRQFISLLIKVRAPKLSKEFKPSRVYDILNDSLQTLSDEDLRAMVEAMEKMDDIQSRLDNLKGAYKDLQIIRNEYLRYNLYMLGKKAQAYVDEKKKADEIKNKQEKKEQAMAENSQKIQDCQRKDRQLADEIHILETEKGTLHLEDVDLSMDKLGEARRKKEEAQAEKNKIKSKIEEEREKIRIYDGLVRSHQGQIDACFQEIEEIQQEMKEENETLLFEFHQDIQQILSAEDRKDAFHRLDEKLKELQKEIGNAYEALRILQETQEQWNKEEEKCRQRSEQKERAETQSHDAEKMETECRDRLIEAFYTLSANNRELAVSRPQLDTMVQLVQTYETPGDQGDVINFYYNLWMEKYGMLNQQKMKEECERGQSLERKATLMAEKRELEHMAAPVPERKERVEEARQILKQQSIPFMPFYEAIDFAENVSGERRDRLEGQLTAAGLLDALVVSEKDRERAKMVLCGRSDTLISVKGEKTKRYPFFVAAAENEEIKNAAEEILEHIFTENRESAEFVLMENGYFRNGILEGYCHPKEEASYVGADARKRKMERLLQEKQEEIDREEENLAACEERLDALEKRMGILQQEKEQFPSFSDLNQAIDILRTSKEDLERSVKALEEQEILTLQKRNEHKKQEQTVIRECRKLPYYRTLEAYEEARAALEMYREQLGQLERTAAQWDNAKAQKAHTGELISKSEEAIDTGYGYLNRFIRILKETEVEIQRLEEYLNDPEIKAITERLGQIREELKEKQQKYHENDKQLAVLEQEKFRLAEECTELRERAVSLMEREKHLKECFAEELELGLVMERETDSVYEAALRAREKVREGDRERSASEMTTALMKTFHGHLASLSSYGISMEECFSGDNTFLRVRQRISAAWNGKKLYLEEFYGVIRESIETTQLLIQQKDRELFEGILADTLSRKLSSRIRESRAWIRDMSLLMKSMDTSMALTFSLEWKPRAAEGEQELDTQELETILARERELLTAEDIDKVSVHFRTRIRHAKHLAEENGEIVNYMDLVREALDYRKWFAFRMNYYRNDGNKKELTNGAFNRFSGGEKAMAMYVPLFAAVNAQYKKAEHSDHPRIIALDEAFAGVDDKNISSMFELVQKMDFDYIMNSQVLWGCYETVKKLRIAELLRPAGSKVVTVIYYLWNGRERILDEQ